MRSKHPVRESLIFLACVLFAIFAAFPIYWMINTALSTDQELYTGQSLWPHLERVLDIPAFLSGSPAFAWLGNSAFIAFGTTFLSLIMAVHGAYALSRFKFFGKGAVGFLLFANRNSFHPSKKAMTAAAAMLGRISGKMIIINWLYRGQPSTRADSSSSNGTLSIAPFRMNKATGIMNPVVASTRPYRLFNKPNPAKTARYFMNLTRKLKIESF